MKMASIVNEYYDVFLRKYGTSILPGQLKALHAIRDCRTPGSGEVLVKCPDCSHYQWHPLSCGHRNCPQCQNIEATRWIDRQQNKLLPVLYFMVTFTLPYEFRPLCYGHQKQVYSIFFACVSSTLTDFGLNSKNLGAQMAMTMVLHTHNRRLDFHPHIHAVVPGGGVDKKRRQWKKKKGKYLFNKKNMAKVFRARFIDALNKACLPIPKGITSQWVVDCTRSGKGINALKYLSRYLYRGVISENNIVSSKDGRVTYKYLESKTQKTLYRTMAGEDFLQLVVQHVLPKGFRRVRDYGFLNGRAKKLLFIVQLILHVKNKKSEPRQRPAFKCPACESAMSVIGFRFKSWGFG